MNPTRTTNQPSPWLGRPPGFIFDLLSSMDSALIPSSNITASLLYMRPSSMTKSPVYTAVERMTIMTSEISTLKSRIFLISRHTLATGTIAIVRSNSIFGINPI